MESKRRPSLGRTPQISVRQETSTVSAWPSPVRESRAHTGLGSLKGAAVRVTAGLRVAKSELVTGTRASTKSTLHSHRAVQWLQPREWYFLVLDSSWLSLSAGVMVLYFLVIMIGSALTLCVMNGLEDSVGESDASDFSIAAQFTVSSVLTLGFGRYLPSTDAAFAVATIQQFVGIVINVAVFSVFVSKLQSAEHGLMFSRKAIITTRNGESCLLFRIANQRRNLLYSPDMRVSLLQRVLTDEGESFVQYANLEVAPPPVMTAVTTIMHRIKRGSPLARLTAEMLRNASDAELAISVVLNVRDSVYKDDLHVSGRYVSSDIVFGPFIFADTLDAETNKVDLCSFGRLVRCKPLLASPTRLHSISQRICRGEEEGEEMPTELQIIEGLGAESDQIVLAAGCELRGAHLRKVCTYCRSIEAILHALQLPYKEIFICLSKKPAWFGDRVTPSFLCGGQWRAGTDALLAFLRDERCPNASLFKRTVAYSEEQRCQGYPPSNEDAKTDDDETNKLMGGMELFRAVESASFGLFMMPPSFSSTDVGTDANSRDAAVVRLERLLLPLARVVDVHRFICGDEVGIEDLTLGVFLLSFRPCWREFNEYELCGDLAPLDAYLTRLSVSPLLQNTFPRDWETYLLQIMESKGTKFGAKGAHIRMSAESRACEDAIVEREALLRDVTLERRKKNALKNTNAVLCKSRLHVRYRRLPR